MSTSPAALLHCLLDQMQTLHLRMCNCVEIDTNWLINQRRIDDHLLYYMHRGRIRAQINNQTLLVNSGELLWVQPQQWQAFSYVDEQAGKIYYLRFALGTARPVCLRQHFLHTTVNDEITRPWQRLNTLDPSSSQYADLHMRCLLSELLIPALEQDNAGQAAIDGLSPAHKEQARQFIQEHIQLRFSISQIADHLGLNPDYFARQFKKSFGRTAQDYIKHERIRQACGLLSESGRSVSAVADFLGYDDPYFFSRQFKSVMKQSPLHWLKQQSHPTRQQ